MALSIFQISQILANKNYYFKVYYSPTEFQATLNSLKHIKINQVQRFKFEYTITDKLSPKEKGFYIFVLEELGFPSIDFKYLLYIGKVEKTNTFRNRFYIYRNSIGKASAMENVMLLTNLWPDNTYVYFFSVSDDKHIEEIEKILVYPLKPDFNEQYFTDRTVKETSLYQIGNP